MLRHKRNVHMKEKYIYPLPTVVKSTNMTFKLGLSNHARLDIRRFGSGIRIHPKVRIVSHRIYETMFAWYMQDYIVESQTIL